MSDPRAYYNENDPFTAQWLRNLMAAGLIMEGEVDDRSIEDVEAKDLIGFTRCHFFAGLAGWDYALQLAGWPADRSVWTGSCPCQPFSAAGKRAGADDARHLWPVWFRLIEECRPATCFGEQVASGDGRAWLAGVRTDLEALGYAVGAADLCAASVGAPHIRQRLWWMADAEDADRWGGINRTQEGTRTHRKRRQRFAGSSKTSGLGNADNQGSQGHRKLVQRAGERAPWAASSFVYCTDGKSRRTESGIFPLAHGVPGRVGQLRAYGNAIAPQVAARFIEAFAGEQK